MSSHYLNTDLCLVSTCDLSPLESAFRDSAEVPFCLHQPDRKRYATINALGSGLDGCTPEQDVGSLIAAIESLDSSTAELFAMCESREMNIGWQASEHRPEGAVSLPCEILAGLVERRIFLAFTVYPSSENERESEI